MQGHLCKRMQRRKHVSASEGRGGERACAPKLMCLEQPYRRSFTAENNALRDVATHGVAIITRNAVGKYQHKFLRKMPLEALENACGNLPNS